MMRATLILLLLALACANEPPRTSTTADPSAPPIEAGIDWQQLPDADALRREYGERADYSALCEDERPLRQAFELLDAEDWAKLDALSEAFLSRCPVDIDFHLLGAIALEQLGRNAEALQHHHWRRALVESVLRSGAGDTSDSPWIVISVPEEYAMLRALGMQREDQALIDGGIDAITVTVDGETRSVYFFPEAHWVRLQRLLGE